ncbi:MAG: hypothetical protein IIA66_00645 [Planctomycetes bacterium]|nr:hypothetical protein [Planctomycetota bacterium]
MRIFLFSGLVVLVLSGAAFAQTGYVYQPSGIEFESSAPLARGETVQGLILLDNGMTALGGLYVEGVVTDDLFTYWVGSYGGDYYYYDVYNKYWKPGPVTYYRASLSFQGEQVSGWTRAFGPHIDYGNFFGQDGVLYKRINIERNRRRNTNRRRQIVYTYFVNMATGERSDGEGLAYRVIVDGGAAVELIEQQIKTQEEKLAAIVEENPAFPMWEVQAFVAPEVIAVPDTIPHTGEQNLLELIESEIGPLSVEGEAAAPKEEAGAEE